MLNILKQIITSTFSFKTFDIDYLTKLNVSYKTIKRNNFLTIILETSIFPKFLHSFKNYNNIYVFTVMKKEFVPSKIFIELSLPEKNIIGLYSNAVHLNSEIEYKYNQKLFNVCVDSPVYNLPNKNYEYVIQKILNRINTWNYLDRTQEIKLTKHMATMIPATEFSIQKLNQLKRLDWIKKVLKERNQKYISNLHF